MKAGCRRLAFLALLHSLPFWQSLAFRRVREEEADKEMVAADEEMVAAASMADKIDWASYSGTFNNGKNAILAIHGAKRTPVGVFQGLVKAAVPFIPPPFGMAVGGVMSLMSGIFGWGKKKSMTLEDLSAEMSQGFAKVTAKLDGIIRKLDLMNAAIDRIEHMTEAILGTVRNGRHDQVMEGFKIIHAEFKVVMESMRRAENSPRYRDGIMREMLQNVSKRHGDIVMLKNRDFGKRRC